MFYSGLFYISFSTEPMQDHSPLKKHSSPIGIYCLSWTAPFFWDSHVFVSFFTCHSFPHIRFFCFDLLKSSECYYERRKKKSQMFIGYNNSFPESKNPMIFKHIKNKNKQTKKSKNQTHFFPLEKENPKTLTQKRQNFFLRIYHALLVIPLPPFPLLHSHKCKHSLSLNMSPVKARISDLKWVASFVWGSLLPFGQSTWLWSVPINHLINNGTTGLSYIWRKAFKILQADPFLISHFPAVTRCEQTSLGRDRSVPRPAVAL